MPDFRAANPYQAMLYAELPGAGIRVAPVRRPDRSLVLRDRADLTGYALHLHWSSTVVQVAPTRDQALTRLETFTKQITDLQARGGRLIWTVHNVLPHETRYLELELKLRQLLAERADIVHVMCPQTVELAAPHFRIDPDRMVVLPHSSYLGIYPNTMTTRQARDRLGLADDDLVLLAMGGIRPYRGLDTLLDAFDAVSARQPRLRLVVVGKPSDGELAEHLLRRCSERPEILVRAEHIADDELQVYHRAADLAVLPYRIVLNSGVLKLAETFGLPVVAPRAGCMTTGPGSRHVLGFDPNLPGDLVRALDEGIELITDPARVAAARTGAMAAAQAYPPQRMSAYLAATLLDRVPPPPPRPPSASPEESSPTPIGLADAGS
jgi:glycosyltransferase involved in cell wall biosynthesis